MGIHRTRIFAPAGGDNFLFYMAPRKFPGSFRPGQSARRLAGDIVSHGGDMRQSVSRRGFIRAVFIRRIFTIFTACRPATVSVDCRHKNSGGAWLPSLRIFACQASRNCVLVKQPEIGIAEFLISLTAFCRRVSDCYLFYFLFLFFTRIFASLAGRGIPGGHNAYRQWGFWRIFYFYAYSDSPGASFSRIFYLLCRLWRHQPALYGASRRAAAATSHCHCECVSCVTGLSRLTDSLTPAL